MIASILLQLTLESVLADIPRDAGALIVYTLLLLLVGFAWHGSRKGSGGNADAASRSRLP